MAELTPHERTQRIEEAARGLVACCREFVGSVRDNSGNELGARGSGEFEEWLSDLEAALAPLPEPEPLLSPCQREGRACRPLAEICQICGWGV